MKRILVVIVIICTGLSLLAQNVTTISGKIIDKKTKESLPYASVVYLKKSLGTISNLKGDFTLSLNNAEKTDSIIISYIGYQQFKCVVEDCIDKNVFALKPRINRIAEVKIKGKKFKLKPFMKEVIAEYNNNRRKTAHIAVAHYREKAKIDNRYVVFNESIGYSIYGGVNVDAAPLSSYNFVCENSRFSIQDTSWMAINKAKEGLKKVKLSPGGGGNLLNAFRYIELKGVLSIKAGSKFNFNLDSAYIFKNKEALCINFKGNGDSGCIHVYSGSKRILKFNCSTGKLWSNKFGDRVKANYFAQFNYFDNMPFVSAMKAGYKKENVEHYISLNVLIQKFNEFNLSNDEYWSMDSSEANPFVFYDPKEWQLYSIMKEKDYEQIVKDLSTKELTLEEQFIEASGKWFRPDNKNYRQSNQLARKTISKLKENF